MALTTYNQVITVVYIFKVPVICRVGVRWLLGGSYSELVASATEMGAFVVSDWAGGGGGWTPGIFYNVVVQMVLLYESESWVMSLWIGKEMCVFHHQVIRRLMGCMPQWNGDRTWTYPTLGEVMVEAVIQEIETYFACRQNNVSQYIATRPILDLCLAAGRRPRAPVLKRWWYQGSINLEGIRDEAHVAEVESNWGVGR